MPKKVICLASFVLVLGLALTCRSSQYRRDGLCPIISGSSLNRTTVPRPPSRDGSTPCIRNGICLPVKATTHPGLPKNAASRPPMFITKAATSSFVTAMQTTGNTGTAKAGTMVSSILKRKKVSPTNQPGQAPL